jgi:hypothetical protein
MDKGCHWSGEHELYSAQSVYSTEQDSVEAIGKIIPADKKASALVQWNILHKVAYMQGHLSSFIKKTYFNLCYSKLKIRY